MINLGELGNSIHVTAEPDGLWFRPRGDTKAAVESLADPSTWPSAALNAPGGVQIALDIEQVLDRDIAELSPEGIKLPWGKFAEALDLGLSVASRWAAASPFLVSIDRHSEIGQPNFRYRYSFLLGGRTSQVDRFGFFLKRMRDDRVFLLDAKSFALLEAMDGFNALPPAERTVPASWEAFAAVRAHADAASAELDAYLRNNTVVVPTSVALDFAYHEDGSLSFVPRCPELDGEDFATIFQQHPTAERLYTLGGASGKKIRVLLEPRHQAVLERMKHVRRARGAAKRQAETHPETVFDGLLADVEIRYGSRVTGIGAFPFAKAPNNPAGGTFFQELDVAVGESNEDSGDRPTKIFVDSPGTDAQREVVLANGQARKAFRDAVADALARGRDIIDHDGAPVLVNSDLLRALDERPGSEKTPASVPPGKYLLIYTDEEEVHPEDALAITQLPEIEPELPPVCLPRSLSEDTTLKAHQLDGVRWLTGCTAMKGKRRGGLLADDMGLGKTLQVLVYLASQIEAGAIDDKPAGGDAGPWRPILIVAPLILVENETWLREMRERFRFDGNIFQPVLSLYGSALGRVRSDSAPKGRETAIGAPLLDPLKLMGNRVVITTYETVVNYQHSFAQLYEGRPLWSVVVTDEAQRYKAMNTKVSHAIKAIPADFHVASTGTPVENRLLDLWNIVDALQPALLGSAREFTREFESPISRGEDPSAILDGLRSRLMYGTPRAFLIRRTKSQLLDLPEKREVRLTCEMSQAERQAHAQCLAALRDGNEAGRHLAVLQRLAAISQHPRLSAEDLLDDPKRAVAESPKLQKVLETLEGIRTRREKVIIFARLIAAQQLLAAVIGDRFGVNVPIINGSMSQADVDVSSGGTTRSRELRKKILDQFRARDGFGVLILSPFVAGVGLTITEANHVIHYGRWWNPAIEAQATDRAYRIGQTRPVTVYYPISVDSAASHSTFDQALDKLIVRKLELARDFLHPINDEDAAAAELRSDLLDGSEPPAGRQMPLSPQAIANLSANDFEALVAAVYEGSGSRTILTAKSGDGGADVIVVRGRGGFLIQVKHHPKGTAQVEAIGDVLAAIDVYRHELGGSWAGTVVTSGVFSRDAVKEAKTRGVSLVDGAALQRLVDANSLSLGEVIRASERRCGNYAEGVLQARDLMQ